MVDLEGKAYLDRMAIEGTRVKVLEEDDGSGWIKISKNSTEKSGLVPASYLKLDADEDSEEELEPDLAIPVPVTSHVQRSGKFGEYQVPWICEVGWLMKIIVVVALYPYDAQGDDELGLHAGERYELTSGEHGGENYGEGWWEGINSYGKHGIFPSNYVSITENGPDHRLTILAQVQIIW
jgi:formin-binding protein 1